MVHGAYNAHASLRYNIFAARPTAFALRIAPAILRFYRAKQIDSLNPAVVDVGCGTGQLARELLREGIPVVGIDTSGHMLTHAQKNNAENVASGQAQFIEMDASELALDRRFGLAVSTYNTLNHVQSLSHLARCISSIQEVVAPGGYFLFDIDTRRGLEETAAQTIVSDTDDEVTLWKRMLDGDRIILYATGCFRHENTWYRYRETITKIFLGTDELRQLLLDAGWSSVTYTADDFTTPVDHPERDARAFCVARRATR